MIVISGGIDLSLGVMVASSTCIAASLMEDKGFGTALLIAVGADARRRRSSARSTAALIVLTGVPDIVVTLAMSFVWGGVALLIMRTPGGGAPAEFQALGTGSFVSRVDPGRRGDHRASCWSLVWLPIRGAGPGFAIYAIGCNRDRAYLSRRQRDRHARARLRDRRLLRRHGRARR